MDKASDDKSTTPNRAGTITSRVLKDPKHWYEEGYLIPHEPLRLGLRNARDALQSGGLDAGWKVDIFFTWFDYFSTLIHHHHDIEEKIFFPWIGTRATVPAKHTKGHQELMTALTHLNSFRPKLTTEYAKADAESAAPLAAEFTNEWCKFLTDMEDHLAQEEEDIPPLMLQHFTEAENDATVQQILQQLGFEGNARELPWVLDAMNQWKGPTETEKWFEDRVPFPVRVLYHTIWKDSFEETYINPLAVIQLKQKPQEEEKCTVQ